LVSDQIPVTPKPSQLHQKGESKEKVARKPMVTRTITTTNATVMCLDVSTGKSEKRVFSLPRTYKDQTAILKKVKSRYETDTLKPVMVLSWEVTKTLYGMTELEFIETANILPSRTN
jgi:hypothetical protein